MKLKVSFMIKSCKPTKKQMKDIAWNECEFCALKVPPLFCLNRSACRWKTHGEIFKQVTRAEVSNDKNS